MKRKINALKQDFQAGKFEAKVQVSIIISSIFCTIIAYVCILLVVFLMHSLGFEKNSILLIEILLTIIAILILYIPPWHQPFTLYCFQNIVPYMGRNGNCVTKHDWRKIKRVSSNFYKILFSEESNGHCYFFSWALALRLNDAKLVYGCQLSKKGKLEAHAFILKNNSVFDTNALTHFDYNEYLESNAVQIYKIFSPEEYETIGFFDNIREDFKQWCEARNAYCDPQ